MAADRRRTPGLTFFEVIVALAIVGILGAVVFSSAAGYADRQRVNESIEMLDRLRLSVYRFDSAVGRFPRRLRHLHTAITIAESNICGVAYETKGKVDQPGAWQAAARGGPFFEYPTPESGFPIAIGLVSDTLTRSPTTASNEDRSFGILQIVVRKVSSDDVAEANLLVDRDNSSTNGAVRWTADGLGTNTMTWNIPIDGC